MTDAPRCAAPDSAGQWSSETTTGPTGLRGGAGPDSSWPPDRATSGVTYFMLGFGHPLGAESALRSLNRSSR